MCALPRAGVVDRNKNSLSLSSLDGQVGRSKEGEGSQPDLGLLSCLLFLSFSSVSELFFFEKNQ